MAPTPTPGQRRQKRACRTGGQITLPPRTTSSSSKRSRSCSMANKLTGSYDAVAQISRRQLNGLLASLHQNGASDQTPLRLGHNGVLRIGDPKPTTPDLVRLRLRNWIRNFQSAGGPAN